MIFMNKANRLFLAAIEEGKGEAWHIDVYLVNPTSQAFEVALIGSSFQGDIDGLVDLGSSKEKKLILIPKSSVQIDKFTDGGELDFTTTYHFDVKDGKGTKTELLGDINGRTIFGPRVNWCRKMKKLPVLKRGGIYVKLDNNYKI